MTRSRTTLALLAVLAATTAYGQTPEIQDQIKRDLESMRWISAPRMFEILRAS